jgi:hypothetical protein
MRVLRHKLIANVFIILKYLVRGADTSNRFVSKQACGHPDDDYLNRYTGFVVDHHLRYTVQPETN